MRKFILIAFIALFLNANSVINAQNIKPSVVTGDVSSVSDSKIVLQTKDGAIDVQLSATTQFKRVPPENPVLTAAVDSNLTEIGVGDKIVASGILSEDKKSLPARTVFLMTKADITKKTNAESEAWRTRSVSGRIVSLNPNTQEFTIAPLGGMGGQNTVISAKENVDYRRYAPDSVKFEDAKPSSFDDLRIGDQIRALGDRGADGTSFKAERIVSGAFKTVGGTITAVDAAKNEITVKEFQTNRTVTIAINNNSQLKKFPEEMASMMAMRMGGGAGMQPPGGQGGQGGQGNVVVRRPPQDNQPGEGQRQGPPGGGQPGAGFRSGPGGLNVNEMFERLPTVSVADLKVGDAVAASTSSTGDAGRVTAIRFIAGVEPFFRAAQMAAGAQRGGGQGGASGGFSIPGLDGGFGTP